jgi:exonuclease III
MKIIFLNAWGGRVESIKKFILDQSKDTDIFCFQESYNSESQIFCLDLLTDYQYFFDKKRSSPIDEFVNCTFVKKNFSVSGIETIGQGDFNIGLGLFTKIEISNNKIINLCNVHGHARPGDKQDNPDRLHQSKLLIDFFKNLTGPKIIGGDFNLDLNIKSVQMFEQNGYRNLIKEFKIPTTRNEISWSKYENKQYFADHLFVSPDIKIKKFSVPNLEISDHLPLILEFEL